MEGYSSFDTAGQYGNSYGSGLSFGSGFSSGSNFSREIDSILSEVQELHNLKENSWSLREYQNRSGVPTWKGSYNSKRKVMRVKGGVKAPLEKVLTHLLPPPYGLWTMPQGQASHSHLVEKLGSGGVVMYDENPGKVLCCCRIAPRDAVFVGGIKILTSDSAVFATKTVEHSSYPPKEDCYRMDIPLMGLYAHQEGDKTRVEIFLSKMDMGGDIGKLGPGSILSKAVQKMLHRAKEIPRQGEISPPPYMQLL